jgi:hypothetical protein
MLPALASAGASPLTAEQTPRPHTAALLRADRLAVKALTPW